MVLFISIWKSCSCICIMARLDNKIYLQLDIYIDCLYYIELVVGSVNMCAE